MCKHEVVWFYPHDDVMLHYICIQFYSEPHESPQLPQNYSEPQSSQEPVYNVATAARALDIYDKDIKLSEGHYEFATDFD